MKKIIIILLVGVVVLVVAGAFIYNNTFGFGAKKKYENCLMACEKAILNDSNMPACKVKCEEVTGYTVKKEAPPAPKDSQKTEKVENSSKTETTETVGETETSKEKVDQDGYYACEWSWPQKVIDKKTKKAVIVCPKTRPWCHSTDLSEEGAGCCARVIESTLEYFDCKTIDELKTES